VHVASIRKRRVSEGGNMREIDQLEDLGIDGRIY
jgi:hypothetical protein